MPRSTEEETEAPDEEPPTSSPERVGGEDVTIPHSLIEGNEVCTCGFVWKEWHIVHLIEAKRLEAETQEQNRKRKLMVSAEIKLKRVQAYMVSKGCPLIDTSKIKNKWESLSSQYKKVFDHNKASGNAPYESMDRTAKVAAKVPLDFPMPIYRLIDCWVGGRLGNASPVMAESMAPSHGAGTSSEPVQPVELRIHNPTTVDPEATSAHNSGKRKREISRSASALNSTLTNFFISIVENAKLEMDREKLCSYNRVEDRRLIVEERKLVVEERKEESANMG